jgi:hypothetical protein
VELPASVLLILASRPPWGVGLLGDETNKADGRERKRPLGSPAGTINVGGAPGG